MTTKEVLTEMREGVEYDLSPVEHKKVGVGFAPTKTVQGDTDDDKLEWLTTEYGSAPIVKCFVRQNKSDAMNNVRGKYNKDKVSATTIINAQKTGEMTTEMFIAAKKDYDANKYDHNWTKCCSVQLGIGDDALDKADATHKHWDCAR